MATPFENLVVIDHWRKTQKMTIIKQLRKQNHCYKTAKIKKERQRQGTEETILFMKPRKRSP
jgi:hypothetical protein